MIQTNGWNGQAVPLERSDCGNALTRPTSKMTLFPWSDQNWSYQVSNQFLFPLNDTVDQKLFEESLQPR